MNPLHTYDTLHIPNRGYHLPWDKLYPHKDKEQTPIAIYPVPVHMRSGALHLKYWKPSSGLRVHPHNPE